MKSSIYSSRVGSGIVPDVPSSPPHGGIPEYLELVELDRRQGERIDGLRLGGHHPVGLARQPENEMRPDMYPACGGRLHSTACAVEIVPRFTARSVSS
mgnify:CR=1 FL=1